MICLKAVDSAQDVLRQKRGVGRKSPASMMWEDTRYAALNMKRGKF